MLNTNCETLIKFITCSAQYALDNTHVIIFFYITLFILTQHDVIIKIPWVFKSDDWQWMKKYQNVTVEKCRVNLGYKSEAFNAV